MERRSFVQSLAGAGMLAGTAAQAQQPGRKTRFYRLDYFSYRQGDQATRLTEFLSSQMPVITKHVHTVGVFTGVVSPHLQTMMVLSGFASTEEMETSARNIAADPGYQKAHAAFESGTGAPYDSLNRVLLEATDYSPEIAPLQEKPKSPRYFELRIYHAPTQRQLAMVHERFTSAEIKIFHRSGVHPIFYSNTVYGPEMLNLTYMIPFATLAEREKAWDAFGADPEWLKVRNESVARGGQIVDFNDVSLWRAAPFSPIQ
jgi:hypothetical protein